MSLASAPATKTQFYSANGAGRDSYIHANNGGFCPEKQPCKIEELGKSLIPQSYPSESHHSPGPRPWTKALDMPPCEVMSRNLVTASMRAKDLRHVLGKSLEGLTCLTDINGLMICVIISN